ncbi:hypothetical protein L2E82_20019 [Cichorium intybus]|uniref:Uncharacterized protein n=1 Tax=Cichorium intybus TaxID=13427 RepID=A0ACB9DS58_CICIN|nr:hypothetical protein L1887_21348 [Cichorium endivia]KAI3749407.1 hypothetical protein L2E82_20019 [Cichorium intybus]
MASTKVVGVLLLCLVILHVNDAQDVAPAPEAEDAAPEGHDGDKCYADCEKACVDEGNARSFCMLKCEKECRKGQIARRFSR